MHKINPVCTHIFYHIFYNFLLKPLDIFAKNMYNINCRNKTSGTVHIHIHFLKASEIHKGGTRRMTYNLNVISPEHKIVTVRILLQMGFPSRTKGFDYLCTAITV